MITFNYKDGSETVSLSEIENSDLSSDLTVSALPEKVLLSIDKRTFSMIYHKLRYVIEKCSKLWYGKEKGGGL